MSNIESPQHSSSMDVPPGTVEADHQGQQDLPIGPDHNNVIEKLKKATRELYHQKFFDIDGSKFGSLPPDLPEVYSEIFPVDFHEGGRFMPKAKVYKEIKLRESELNKKLTFEKLVSACEKETFISIVGYPAAGKTVLSKRLARNLSQNKELLVLLVLFKDRKDCTQSKVTLKEFLLENVDCKLEEEEELCAFNWIKNHPNKCIIIFDGFDQVIWNLMENKNKNKQIKPPYNDPLTLRELLSTLCQGQFLKNCHIIFTSRPHAMLHVPEPCRPSRTYFIRGLTVDDMETLFFALAGSQRKAELLWNKLERKTPEFKTLCNNPLMLHLCVRAVLCLSEEGGVITTMTEIFHAVLQNLKASGHAVSMNDAVVTSLSRIAFKAARRGNVVITNNDLKKEDLTRDQVKDLFVKLPGSNEECGVVEGCGAAVGNQRLYFTHERFQEFFAALYVSREMPLKKFASFVGYNILTDHWFIVMQFMAGLLLDQHMKKDLLLSSVYEETQLPQQLDTSSIASQHSQSPQQASFLPVSDRRNLRRILGSSLKRVFQSDRKAKKNLFLTELRRQTKKIANEMAHHQRLIPVRQLLRECNSEKATRRAAEGFIGGWMSVSGNQLTQDDADSLACVIREIPGELRGLDLIGCNMTTNIFLPLREAMKNMRGRIGELYIGGNCLTVVDDVITILHKVGDEVNLQYCFVHDRGEGYRCPTAEEKNKLQEALDGLENIKLKIAVGLDDDGKPIFLKHKDREGNSDED